MNIARNRDRIESALRMLASFEFSTNALWMELEVRLEKESNAAPRPDDMLYELPVDDRKWEDLQTARASAGLAQVTVTPVLTCATCYAGWQYELSPGQREWLRNNFNMTPAKQVVILEVAVWVDTRHPKELVLRSCEHVNPALRRNTLVMARITNAGTFFKESAALDAAREEDRVSEMATSASSSKKSDSIKDLDVMMAELEKELA